MDRDTPPVEMNNGVNSFAPSGSSVAMIHGSTDVKTENSKFINTIGGNTIYNETYNINMGALGSENEAIIFLKTAAQDLASNGKNQSTGVEGSEPLPKAVNTGHTSGTGTYLEGNKVNVCNMMPPDPSALRIASIADRYTRSMLVLSVGYPLYEPEPFIQHPKKDLSNGVNIGDVGLVRDDGAFDILFNICPPQNGSITPCFSLETSEHSATRPTAPLSRGACFFSQTVTKLESGKYICKGPEGAILVLPEGAIQYEVINKGRFEDLAKRHGVEWYKHVKSMGRSISNGSLYLVTSVTKCTHLGIAVFDRPCEPGQGVKFCRKSCFPFCNSRPKYRWKGSGAFITKIATPNPDQKDAPNKCVFLRGYKIMLREDIFYGLSSTLPRAGSSGSLLTQWVLADRMRGGASTGRENNLMSTFTRTRTNTGTVTSANINNNLHANFNSPPIHPSDLFNAALLRKNPRARVALAHDDVWCDLLRENFLTLDTAKLADIVRSYTSTVDKYGCVSLKKISDPIVEGATTAPAIRVRGG